MNALTKPAAAQAGATVIQLRPDQPDPIIAAIEAHKKARAAYSDLAHEYSELERTYAENNGGYLVPWCKIDRPVARGAYPAGPVTIQTVKGIEAAFPKKHYPKQNAEARKALARARAAKRKHYGDIEARMERAGAREVEADRRLRNVIPMTAQGAADLLEYMLATEAREGIPMFEGETMSLVLFNIWIAMRGFSEKAQRIWPAAHRSTKRGETMRRIVLRSLHEPDVAAKLEAVASA